MELLHLSGGWARVAGSGFSGWLRASQLALDAAEPAAASLVDSGRRAAGASAVTLGVRTLPARSTRHALIIGVGSYQVDATRPVSALSGVRHDMSSALAMAALMQVPTANITLLRDGEVTRDAVQRALQALEARVQPGDRVFLYWSGHGSRYFDPAEEGCVETLVPHDLRDISNREFAQWLAPVAGKADKMLVVYDACHSGGVGGAAAPARALGPSWTPKYTAGVAEACLKPSNLRTRSLVGAAAARGISGQDVVHLSSSRPDEVSFDSAESGGLATSSLLACLRGEARDLDSSGAVSVDELAQCAQQRIDRVLRGHPQIDPPHLVINGNRGFVPARLEGSTVAAAPAPMPPAAPAATPVAAPVSVPVAAPAAAPLAAPPVRNLLEDLHAQRDDKRRVSVQAVSDRLRIGRDALDISVTSSHAGWVYVAMLGSDRESLVLLFPNELDPANRISAGETLLLPRPGWRLTAGGPPGEDTLLVMVTDGPRELATLSGGRSGPFARPLTDAQGRAQLQVLLGQNARGGPASCQGSGCSDAFGSALITLQEYGQ
ncbi:MAG: caspase family protein [Rubrivivax sp.]